VLWARHCTVLWCGHGTLVGQNEYLTRHLSCGGGGLTVRRVSGDAGGGE